MGGSFVAGAPKGESCKNTQFIKDVSVHTFPKEKIQSLDSRKLSARFARASTVLAPAESFLTTSDDSP